MMRVVVNATLAAFLLFGPVYAQDISAEELIKLRADYKKLKQEHALLKIFYEERGNTVAFLNGIIDKCERGQPPGGKSLQQQMREANEQEKMIRRAVETACGR